MGKFDLHHPLTHRYVGILRKDPCIWCGGDGGTIEHITLRSKFRIRGPDDVGLGRDNWQNLASSCEKCNQDRMTKGILEFIIESRLHHEV